ncbi:MAG TPA: EAL domain-containing protein [Nocardioidaceae bacterium]|nr:EAL domain-containing protein [Nocardioidaceae bacterium]
MTQTTASILVVDDEPQNVRLLELFLQQEGYLTRGASSGIEALDAIATQAPDLILLDVMMPDADGYGIARTLKADPVTAGIPVILISALGDRTARLKALAAGAEDFLTKPVDRAELWLRVRNLLRLKDLGDALQQMAADLERQVSERTADLQHLAHFDALTGLPNRTLFFERLSKTLPVADAAVLFLDVDGFKYVNDTRGHAAGDALLRQVGERLTGCLRLRDTVGRLGGDEFAAILIVEDGAASAAIVAQKLLEVMRVPFEIDGVQVNVTVSIGIALQPEDASVPELLLQYADTAMYRAKEAGRDTFRFSTAQMNADIQARLQLEAALRSAVDDEQFVLHYQPKVDLGSGQVAGFEALLRWERPGHGLVGPSEFIPVLESTGLIVSVGRWVLFEVCRQIAQWSAAGRGPLTISANVSGRQFADGDLVADVTAALDQHQVDGHLLELELTESVLMDNTEHTIEILQNLQERGVRISVDDFGTGYSSLAYLRRFPINTLKIDVAFVRDITTSADDAALALAIIRLAHSLKLDVIAEGVETAEQLAYLRRHHCDQIQGYFFSRPLAIAALDAFLAGGPRLVAEDDSQSQNKVLLFAQNPADLRDLQSSLAMGGYHVLLAHSVADGLNLLALHHVQVLVCAPPSGHGGADFLDVVRELQPDALRIVVGGSEEVAALTHAINRGDTHRYYTDSWDVETLREQVRVAFRQYWLRHEGPQDTPGAAGLRIDGHQLPRPRGSRDSRWSRPSTWPRDPEPRRE